MPVFVDTNVLVYWRDSSEPAKQPVAASWLEHLWRTREGRLSFQVLQEFYVTVTTKLSPGLKPDEARANVRSLLAWRPITVHAEVLERAWSIEDRYGLSFWDALIVSAASASGCDQLLTEDMQDDSLLEGVRIVNPFVHAPPTGS